MPTTRLSTSTAIPGTYSTPLLLLLIAAGLAGNYFRYPIFLNIDFLFGSIFALLALQIFGPGRGIPAAAVIACYTYIIWNHPYAIIIMTAEVAVVGFLMTRRKMGMVLADTLYWLVIGMPLVYLCYHLVMHVPPSNTYIVMTKQTINGIANALAARMIFSGFAFRFRAEQISYNEIIYNLLAFFVLCPALVLLAVSSRTDFMETDLHIRTSLIQDSQLAAQRLGVWIQNRKTAITHLSELAAVHTPQEMQPRLEQARQTDHNFEIVTLLNKEAVTTAFSPLIDELGQSTIGKSYADRPYLLTLKRTLKPMLTEVSMSRFGVPRPLVRVIAPVVLHGEYRGYVSGALKLQQIQEYLNKSTGNNSTLYTLIDKNSNIIMTNYPNQKIMQPLMHDKGTLKRFDDAVSQWIPDLPPNTPISERWKKSYYIVEVIIGDLAEWKIILEQPVAPFQKKLYDNYTGKLTILLLILLASLGLAEKLSHRSIAVLQESEERFRNMSNAAPVLIWMSGTDKLRYWFNQVWLDFTGRSMEQEAGNGWAEGVHPDDLDRCLETYVTAFDNRRPFTLEFRLRAADGKYCWLIGSGVPTFIDNAFTGYIGSCVDITDRKQAEFTLAANNKLLQTIINTIPMRIFWKDKDFRLLGCNLAFARDGGSHPDDLIGKYDYQIVGKELAELYRDADRHVIESKVSLLSYEEPLTTAKGDRIWLSTSKVPLFNDDGESIGILGVYDDITERKQAEEELQRAKEAAEIAALAKSRFLSVVAHEFHTPLHLLNISTDILDTYGERLSNEEKQEQHQQIRNSAQLMTNLVDSVYTFNRQEKADYSAAPVLLDIAQVCSIISGEVKRAWSKDHDFLVSISSGCGTGVLDDVLLRRILENLLTNAFRFTPAGGRVTLSVSRQDDRLNIEVSDTGIGIPEEDQEKIFEAFYRSSNVEARRGLGLGLSIVRDALQELNGSITLTSRVGKGSAFRVELPVLSLNDSQKERLP
ncbi:MAG: ATP-binding protein [Desulfuromonadales bacterium]